MAKVTKIRRHPTRPDRSPELFPGKLKRFLVIDESGSGGFVAYCDTRRWWWVNEVEDGVKSRSTYVWMFVDDELVGVLDIREYRMSWISNDLLWRLMDSESKEAVDMAEILIRCWRNVWEDLASEGSIVLLSQLWVAQKHARSSRWNDILQQLLATRFKRRCMTVLKAFPLEYEAKGKQPGFRLRHQALIRLYRRVLGVEPFPGKPGHEGWLYAIPERVLGLGVRKPKKLLSIRRLTAND
ncbi:hypothetical protein [Bosea sp. (in: a-proteobacteria)]|jgi:hypothetical protein|uniref:hypothetical protein n=1 Tax=Bosea sp. (in: a-proteobacteria) TaxID=1871050 RepID=UPI002DDD765F|nr:hypothetical protein [Bosea sp. (in: a-proteobacteria)]HEV2508627.1 hypothetical protein [Bosea sp. (in: a-proteobacteria)]